MSKEREFLKKLRYASLLENDLRKELEELLAQPEQEPKFNFDLERMKAAIESPISDVTVEDLMRQVKQEPIGYLYKQKDCYGEWATIFKVDKPYITWHDIKDIIPVYTAPPKREPLSDKEITKNTPKLIHIGERLAFHAGVRFAEKAHGIGGGE